MDSDREVQALLPSPDEVQQAQGTGEGVEDEGHRGEPAWRGGKAQDLRGKSQMEIRWRRKLAEPVGSRTPLQETNILLGPQEANTPLGLYGGLFLSLFLSWFYRHPSLYLTRPLTVARKGSLSSFYKEGIRTQRS